MEKTGDRAALTVEDGGELSEAEFSQFLNPFRRESEAQGLGLGLTLVDRVISQMGGALRFQEKPTRISIDFKEAL